MNQKINSRYILNVFSVSITSILFAGVLLTVLLIFQLAYSLYHPNRISASGDFLKENNVEYQNVTLTTQDGLELAAWYAPPKNGALILVAHGYNDNRPESLYVLFAKNDYGVLAWDFRAHGDSEGEFSTLGHDEQLDVEAALDFALAQEGVETIGAWGGSMGAATVLLTASKRVEIEAVVSDSSFTSLEEVLYIHETLSFLHPFFIFVSEYQTGIQVEDVNVVNAIGEISPRAVFIVDGVANISDTNTSPYRLFESANEPKEIWVEEGVPHLGMYTNNPKRYENKVIQFFDAYLLKE